MYSSTTKMDESSREWPTELKCLATGFSRRRFLMSYRWPFIRMWRAFSVSPTYWIAHVLHSITYITLDVLQSAEDLIRCTFPVTGPLNLLIVLMPARFTACLMALGIPRMWWSWSFKFRPHYRRFFKLGGEGATMCHQWWIFNGAAQTMRDVKDG